MIYVKVDREEMIRRNSQRRFCLGISGDFPVLSDEDVHRCEELGGSVGTRPDDEPGKFATRWDEFMKRTYPVVEQYREQNILYEIDGRPSIEEVHGAVMTIISSFDKA